jgi:hypothetical protein
MVRPRGSTSTEPDLQLRAVTPYDFLLGMPR